MSDHDIYRIIESLDAAQKSVKQLPALFKPAQTSPQLSGPYPGVNATRGYLVGESEGEEETTEAEIIPIRPSGVKFANRKDYLDKRDVIFRILSQPGLDPETKEDLKVRLSDFEQAAKTQGLISEDEDEQENPMRQAVMHRIVNQHPEWITKYGAEALVQAIDDVTEGEDDWEEIGSSDVSAYVHYVKDALDDRMGGREEMDDRKPFAEDWRNNPIVDKDWIWLSNLYSPKAAEIGKKFVTHYNITDKDDVQLAVELIQSFIDEAEHTGQPLDLNKMKSQIASAFRQVYRGIGQSPSFRKKFQEQNVAESATTEDVISTVKRKLGDYLQDVATAIQKDPDLLDKVNQAIDQVGPAVKTIKTDDGHEIKIHGNEDDGFRISIKNRPAQSIFKSLDEATMACEMYCSHRRNKQATADYIEEKHIS